MAELLAAVKAKDYATACALLEAGGKEAASYEFYKDGTWGARDRESPIHVAIQNIRNERYQEAEGKQVTPQWRNFVLELMRKGANVNAKQESYDWRGCGSSQTAFEMLLQMSLATGDGEMLALALQGGGDPNTRSVSDTHSMRTDGRTVTYPIHKAARHLSYDCLKTLLDAKADPNNWHTAVYHNERGYNSDMAETALHAALLGAKQNKQGEQPADPTAHLNNVLRVVALLLEAGADVNAERRELIQEEVEVNSPTDDPRDPAFISSVRCVPRRETPLVLALRLGLHADVVRLLMIHGANTAGTLRYGSEPPRSVWDLADKNDEELQSALRCVWEPKYHRLYPADMRSRVFTLLCAAKRQAWPLPIELVHLIIQWVAAPTAKPLPVPPQKNRVLQRFEQEDNDDY